MSEKNKLFNLTWKERFIAIFLGIIGCFAADWILKSLQVPEELHHFFSNCILYFLVFLYVTFELLRDGERLFSKSTILWIVSNLFMLSLRVLLFFLGVLPDEGPPRDKFEWMTVAALAVIFTLWLQKIFHTGPIGEGNFKKEKPSFKN